MGERCPLKKRNFESEKVITILTDQPINEGLLDYLVAENSVSLGQFVEVPLGNRTCVGVVWNESSNKIPRVKLKKIIRIIDIPPMSDELKNFLIEVAKYTVNSLSKVFKLSLGILDLKRLPKGKKFFKVR